MKSTSKSMLRLAGILFLIVAIGVALVGYIFLFPNFKTKTDKIQYLYLYEDANLRDVVYQLNEKTDANMVTFKLAVAALRYENIRSGKYEVNDGENNLSLVRKLRNGNQIPVNLKFNSVRTKEQLASVISKQMMSDSISILALLNDTGYMMKFGLTPSTSISLFLPNTYELFWNSSAEKIFERMHREYTAFWSEERKQKAADIPLSQTEVSTLASIVDSETNTQSEKPIVAGLYINRLRKGIPLQADPTVIYAIGDFSIRRVLNEHTRYDSPYNTYRCKGLPPGPIRVPSLTGIDAVLNYDKNNYIFMCAKETFNGEHNFARTWSEHLRNAARYQKALNERGIK